MAPFTVQEKCIEKDCSCYLECIASPGQDRDSQGRLKRCILRSGTRLGPITHSYGQIDLYTRNIVIGCSDVYGVTMPPPENIEDGDMIVLRTTQRCNIGSCSGLSLIRPATLEYDDSLILIYDEGRQVLQELTRTVKLL